LRTDEGPSEAAGSAEPSEGAADPARARQPVEQARLLALLCHLERQLGSTLDVAVVASRAVVLARQATGAVEGGILLLDGEKQARVLVPAAQNRPAHSAPVVVRGFLGRALSCWAAQRRTGLLVRDTRVDPQWNDLARTEGDIRSVVAVPLLHRGRLRGGLVLAHHDPHHFTPSHLELLTAAAPWIATALERASLHGGVTRDRARLEAIVVNLTDALFALDADGRVFLANPTLERLVGRPATELLGRDYRQCIRLEHHARPWPIDQVLGGRYTSFDMDMLLRNAAGEEIPVRVGCGAIPGERGRPGGAVVVLCDIRYLKEIEGLREDLSNMLVHDLKGPLASIGSSVQLLQQYPANRIGTETLQELLAIADRSVRRLSRMVEAVLDVQQMEAGQFPLQAGPVRLSELVAQVMEEVAPLVADSGIETRIRVAEDLPAIHGDRDVLLRVLWNLLDNSLKYTPRGGLIAVTAGVLEVPGGTGRTDMPQDLPVGRWVIVDIADSGLGIPAEERERIFGKFAQGRRGPVRRRGVGLGLAFCRLAVEAHGGRIWVQSGRGQGSIFTFTLPIAAEARGQ